MWEEFWVIEFLVFFYSWPHIFISGKYADTDKTENSWERWNEKEQDTKEECAEWSFCYNRGINDVTRKLLYCCNLHDSYKNKGHNYEGLQQIICDKNRHSGTLQREETEMEQEVYESDVCHLSNMVYATSPFFTELHISLLKPGQTKIS